MNISNALSSAGIVIEWVYNRLGDPRSKNVLLLVLTLMSLFGMIAPDTATALRNTVLSFLF